MLCSPTFNGLHCSQFVTSIVRAVKDLSSHGISTLYTPLVGIHWVDFARDVLAHLFLQSDCTHMIQIDADLGFDPLAVRKLLRHDKDIIGGAYRVKTDYVNVYTVKDNSNDRESIHKVQGLTGGFMMVKRGVIEYLSDGLPKYSISTLDYGMLEVAPLFTREIKDHSYIGEDYAFCNRAVKAGYDLWLEPDIDFEHVGNKSFKGNYSKCH